MISSTQSDRSPIVDLVDAAAKRRLFVITIEHLAFALIAFGAAAILLLLLGSDILAWPWLVTLILPGLLLFGARMRSDLMDRYRVAQIFDKRLRLDDSLSTAWFLLSHPASAAHPLANAQIERTLSGVRELRAAQAFPFVWRRNWVFAGALCAIALGLFTARYLFTSSLSLKQSWLPLPALFTRQQATEARHPAADGGKLETASSGDRRRVSAQSRTPQSRDTERSARKEQKAANAPGPRNPLSSEPSNTSEQAPNDGSPQQTLGANMSASGSERSKDQNAAARGRLNGSGPEDKPGSREEAQNQPGLAEKVKDALSGLLDKMRPRDSVSSKTGDERSAENRETASQNVGNSQDARQNSGQAKSGDQQKQGRDGGAQAKAAAQASERVAATAKGSSDDGAGHKDNQAHSGIGRQDGEKALKEADQLRAMGKLEEIIGKRSAALTGDMTIETQSGHQQLQTQYTGRTSHHADLGGEIDANEVPVALQSYVREYMEQVRKQANGNQ